MGETSNDPLSTICIIDGPGDHTRVPMDPNAPETLELERYMRFMLDKETNPRILEGIRRGLQRLEERRRNGHDSEN
jgi:hypothetical protein